MSHSEVPEHLKPLIEATKKLNHALYRALPGDLGVIQREGLSDREKRLVRQYNNLTSMVALCSNMSIDLLREIADDLKEGVL